MANSDQLALLKQNVHKWNSWRRVNQSINIDLSGAYLGGADLDNANLSGANLCGAYLYDASLTSADLTGADFSEAGLVGADFTDANLCLANLTRAEISLAYFIRSNLSHSNFNESYLGGTVFVDVNLGKALYIDTCIHLLGSFIDYCALQQSGSLPIAFLRGCGLPDLLIDYLPSLLIQPVQFYSCFISYSSTDEDFAQRLHADLQSKGVRCWFAPKDIKAGKKLHEQIGEAIRFHEKLLLVLSEHSINSEWVKTEIAKARKREVLEKRQVLFPIRLMEYEATKKWECFDADTGKDSAREIREYFIPDFSNWKNHDAYQQAFDRLLKDLKPELERKPEE